MSYKVLIVDDSVLMRKILTDIINQDKDFEVVDTAKDGFEAIDKFKKHNPDIVTLDIEMPKMNGLICLEQLMKIRYVPVIIISAYSKEGSKISLNALQMGAVDIIEKPSGSVSLDINLKSQEILTKLKYAVKVNVSSLIESVEIKGVVDKKRKIIKRQKANRLIAIAASTGGPKTLMELIPKIRGDINAAIAIVQHMPPGFTQSFAERLNDMSELNVFEAYEGFVLNNGDCVIAKGGKHLIFDEEGIIRLDDSSPYHSVKPSADIMMLSAIKYFKSNIIGVVLTGMGKDGSEGIVAIKMSGGINIAESEKSAIIYGMPKSAYNTGKVDYILTKYEIPLKLEKILYEMERS